jgi:hypothetical protein
LSSQRLKLDRYLRHILIDKGLEIFTISELTDQYLGTFKALSGRHLDPSETRKWIYRRIYKLVKSGFLEKRAGDSKAVLAFKQTDLIKSANIIETSNEHIGSLAIEKSVPCPDAPDRTGVLRKLEERAKQYQVDLITSLGESEEYMCLYESFPSLKLQLEKQYHQARERSSKLLGQLTAIKTMIAQFSSKLPE